MDDLALAALRARTLAAARVSDRRRRRRHRATAAAVGAGLVALLTAGGLALAAPPPPDPLGGEEAYALYESAVEAHWADIQRRFPGAERPDADFERFVTRDEEPTVLAACLRGEGLAVGPDGSTSASPGTELEHELAWFVCTVRFPLSPNEYLPYTEDELRHIHRYFTEQLLPCLEGRGYEIGDPPGFDEFRARWWTDDTWSPYRDVAESDADAFAETERECPPLPPDLRG